MKFFEQVFNYSCGAGMLRNLLSLYGKQFTEKKLRDICGTNTAGTSEKGLKKACDYFGFDYDEYNLYTKKEGYKAFNYVKSMLENDYKVILCVDNFAHWILCAGIRGDTLMIIDSKDKDSLIKYYTKEEILTRWWSKNTKCCRSQYYGLAVKVKGNI